MNHLDALPAEVVELLRTRPTCEYATVSQAGIPIDTPTYLFPSADLSTFDIATGLAYPAKADRARRYPYVGLMIERDVSDPVISIAGRASVRDADLQGNLQRYLRETILLPEISPASKDWKRVREAVHYLARIFVEITPARIRWWPNRNAMDDPPNEWRARPGTRFPASDPPPEGKASEAPRWPRPPWQELAERALERGSPAFLTLCCDQGYPLPFRVHEVRLTNEGFKMIVPKSVPWREGKATLSFMGWEVFVGSVTNDGRYYTLRVQRCLPILPLVQCANPIEWQDNEVHGQLLRRLRQEAERRGQAIPVAPIHPPRPSVLARIRAVQNA